MFHGLGRTRLPSLNSPSHYDLTIKTDLKQSLFQGKVEIECADPTASSVARHQTRLMQDRPNTAWMSMKPQTTLCVPSPSPIRDQAAQGTLYQQG